jgi:hypothetical protein
MTVYGPPEEQVNLYQIYAPDPSDPVNPDKGTSTVHSTEAEFITELIDAMRGGTELRVSILQGSRQS